MLSEIPSSPFLFSALELVAQEVGGRLAADVRIRFSAVETSALIGVTERTEPGDSIAGEVLSLRVVGSRGWDPDQHIYFEGTEGAVTLITSEADAAQVRGRLRGFYRPPVLGALPESDSDFLEAPAVPAILDLNLLLRLPPSGEVIPEVRGALSISCEAFEAEFHGVSRIDASVTAGQAHWFPHNLPAVDPSGEAYSYYLEVLPLLVQEDAGDVIFSSPRRLLGGAARVWESCGIEIICKPMLTFSVDRSVMQDLEEGTTRSLRAAIRQRVPRNEGVPVAFVPPLFSKGGGQASDHGPQRAIVVVTEQSAGNSTLLAHELGHVLGGKESGSPQTANYWVGEVDKVMEATGDVKIPAPGQVGASDCIHALSFALWRRL